MRIILFTGKGGVGKTTIAAATAIQTAARGRKTLVISTDSAHSLADSLDQKLSPEPVEVMPNLFAQEFDVFYSMEKYWGNMRNLMQTVFKWSGVDSVVAEELSVLPGMEEASAFLWLEKYYREKEYDLIVIDSAPTGETLALLSLPQTAQSWIAKAFSRKNIAVRTATTGLSLFTGIPLGKGLEEMEELFKKLEEIHKILQNPSICSVRIIANPEKMVIKEAKRAYTYLQLYGYNVDAFIVNRIIAPKSVSDPFQYYLESQEKYLEEIQQSFFPIPVLKVNHLGREVFGTDLLEQIGHSIYDQYDPSAVLYLDEPFRIIQAKQGYLVRIKLSFAKAENISVNKFRDELVIDLDNRRKSVFLPSFAKFLKMETFKFDKPWLTVSLVQSPSV